VAVAGIKDMGTKLTDALHNASEQSAEEADKAKFHAMTEPSLLEKAKAQVSNATKP
jgi:hypothetical protein